MTGSTAMSLRRLRDVAGRVFHRILELAARLLFSVVYSGSKEKVPPINNMLLLESASSLAQKIRSRKVCMCTCLYINLNVVC